MQKTEYPKDFITSMYTGSKVLWHILSAKGLAGTQETLSREASTVFDRAASRTLTPTHASHTLGNVDFSHHIILDLVDVSFMGLRY